MQGRWPEHESRLCSIYVVNLTGRTVCRAKPVQPSLFLRHMVQTSKNSLICFDWSGPAWINGLAGLLQNCHQGYHAVPI